MKFYKRMLLTVSITLIIAFAMLSVYYISRMQREMEKRTMDNLEFTAVQFSDTINSGLTSIINISNWLITNEELNERLNYRYSHPYEYWEFYDYLTQLCNSMIQLEDSIRLITILTPNETLKEDKKNVRSISTTLDPAIYESVMERRGSALFCMMRDAVDPSYFTHNVISDSKNICMLRVMDYKGVKYILMIEIKAQLFLNEFCREEGKGMYVEDNNGQIVIYYENGKNLWTKELTPRLTEVLKNDNIYLTQMLNNQWSVCLFVDRREMLEDINRTLRSLILTSLMITLVVLLANALIIRRTSRQLLKLNDVIQKAYQIGERKSAEEPEELKEPKKPKEPKEPVDEVERITNSFEHLMQRVEYLMNEVYKKEIRNKSMELELLHFQIKPHFLYNTLSLIASLARRYQDEKLMNMINSLSDLYRISLSRGKDIITVEKEIEMMKSYLFIMENRFENMIHVEFKIQEDVLQGQVPKILLQPFVENAINHGMRLDRILNIIIDIRLKGENLIFQIYDDGLGMDETQLYELWHGTADDSGNEHGYGIPNVHRRIQMYMGEAYGVEILSKKDVGTNIKITMPFWDK